MIIAQKRKLISYSNYLIWIAFSELGPDLDRFGDNLEMTAYWLQSTEYYDDFPYDNMMNGFNLILFYLNFFLALNIWHPFSPG